MNRLRVLSMCLMLVGPAIGGAPVRAEARQPIRAIYIPLADHYAGLVAYEKYRDKMVHADYTVERMKNWSELRAYFISGEVDLAYIIINEQTRQAGDKAMKAVSDMIRKHIPEHNEEAIIQSLRLDLNVINFKNLNVDKGGLRQVMSLAVEGNVLKEPIDIDAFADESFSTTITEVNKE